MQLPKSIIKVTLLSKLSAMVIFVILPFVFFGFGYRYGYIKKHIEDNEVFISQQNINKEEKPVNPLQDYFNKVDKYIERNYLTDPYIALGTEIGKNLYVNENYNFQFVLPPNRRCFNQNEYSSIRQENGNIIYLQNGVWDNGQQRSSEIVFTIYQLDGRLKGTIQDWWLDNLKEIEIDARPEDDFTTLLNPQRHIGCIKKINPNWDDTVFATHDTSSDKMTKRYYIPLDFGKPFVLAYSVTNVGGIDECADPELNFILSSISEKIKPRYQ